MIIFACTEDAAINAIRQMRGIVGDRIISAEINPKDTKLFIAKYCAKPKRRGIVKFHGVTGAVLWVKHPLVAKLMDNDICGGYALSDNETWIAILDRKAVTFDEKWE